jgi:hypothetical protein
MRRLFILIQLRITARKRNWKLSNYASAQAKRRCCCSAESSARAKFFLSLFWGDTKGDTKRVNYANNFITKEAAAAGRFSVPYLERSAIY